MRVITPDYAGFGTDGCQECNETKLLLASCGCVAIVSASEGFPGLCQFDHGLTVKLIGKGFS